ncbi:conserved hypothetical protein [Streptomyces viridochromogenes DSM 40736]|uniref:Uncharacterized protein n=1 Tax=Streptomyces viridochromogenes (strain DSM 40736 / JCM 4977 / BCRC 1201 / Tue 494) TaxID=591159 RepID=D9X8D9_STRVT|nr:conserved hypothetical protein [Streptomyces viridochromogenes DSM 40736]
MCPLAPVSHVTAVSQARPKGRVPRAIVPYGMKSWSTREERGMHTGMRQGPEIWIRGPVSTPAPGPPPEPGHARAGARRFSWVGTHGGAGVSTLAAVYGGHDSGRAWPGPGDPPSVLLVARTHAAGLDAVAGAVEVFRRGQAPPGLDLDGVVLVADAPGRLPRPLTQRVKFPGVGDRRVPGAVGGGLAARRAGSSAAREPRPWAG